MKNNQKIISEWLEYACDRRITFLMIKHVCESKDNFPSMSKQVHRWDQRYINCNLAIKHGLSVAPQDMDDLILNVIMTIGMKDTQVVVHQCIGYLKHIIKT